MPNVKKRSTRTMWRDCRVCCAAGRSVGELRTTTLHEPREQSESVRRTAAAAGVPLLATAPGERRRIGPVSWQALWPPPAPAPSPDGPNDASVTLLARSGDLTITIDFDLQTDGTTVTYQRAAMAYDKAVEQAIEGARRYLPAAAIKEITSEMDLSYRWTRQSHTQYKRPEPEGETATAETEKDATEEFDLADES